MARKIKLILLILVLGLSGMPAYAQVSCDTPYEVIVTLRPPRLGVPTVWESTYGKEDKMVQMESGVPVAGGTVMTVGRTLSQDHFTPENTVLAEINRRGRVLTEKMYPAKDAEMPVKILAVKNGYIVMSNIRGGSNKDRRLVRLSWFDKEGNYKKDRLIEDVSYDYDGTSLARAAEEDGIIVVVHSINHKLESDQHGMIFRFAPDGREIWQRAYRPGIPNQIYGIEPIDDGSYIAMGRIRMDDGRMAGWAMKLGFDGTVLWQRTYPRGAFSAFRYAVTAGHEDRRHFILLGESMPLDKGPKAAWLMVVDATGEPQWQRYFRRPDTAFSPVGLMRIADGRLIVPLNAKPLEDSAHNEHVRMLVLSSRGTIVEDETYIAGTQARATDFVPGWNGERVVVATIETQKTPLDIKMTPDGFAVVRKEDAAANPDAPPPAEKEKPALEGWVFVATALDPYDDPCTNAKR